MPLLRPALPLAFLAKVDLEYLCFAVREPWPEHPISQVPPLHLC